LTLSTPTNTSRITAIVEGLLSQGGRERIIAEREAERQAARQAEARAAIAAIAPKRAAVVKAWLAQLATVRTAMKQLLETNARLSELAEADSDLYNQQDRIRFSASVPDPLGARALGALQPLDYLTLALAEVEDQARRALEVLR
jgi:hypothetical protein